MYGLKLTWFRSELTVKLSQLTVPHRFLFHFRNWSDKTTDFDTIKARIKRGDIVGKFPLSLVSVLLMFNVSVLLIFYGSSLKAVEEGTFLPKIVANLLSNLLSSLRTYLIPNHHSSSNFHCKSLRKMPKRPAPPKNVCRS